MNRCSVTIEIRLTEPITPQGLESSWSIPLADTPFRRGARRGARRRLMPECAYRPQCGMVLRRRGPCASVLAAAPLINIHNVALFTAITAAAEAWEASSRFPSGESRCASNFYTWRFSLWHKAGDVTEGYRSYQLHGHQRTSDRCG